MHSSSHLRLPLLVACLTTMASLWGCGGEASVPEPPPPLPPLKPATELVLLSGDGQPAVTVGETLAVRARMLARNPDALPVPGVVTVTFRFFGSNGIQVSTDTADAAGIVSVKLAVDTVPGPYIFVTTIIKGAEPFRPTAKVNATALVGAPVSITAKGSQNDFILYGGVSVAPPTFTVRDRYKNPIANVLVSFRADSGGVVTPASATTDSLGRVSPQTWTVGPDAGTYAVVATVGSISATTSLFVPTGPPATARIVSGDSQQVAPDSALRRLVGVEVRDAAGRVIAQGPPRTWSDVAAGIVLCTSGDFVSPYCSWRPGVRSGAYKLRVTVGAATATATAFVVDPPSRLDVVSGPLNSSIPLGSSNIDIVVRLTLPSGTPAVGYNITVEKRLTVPDDSLKTDGDGVARVRWTPQEFIGTQSVTLYPSVFPTLRQSVSVSVFGTAIFSDVSAGDGHTCGSTARASRNIDLQVLCWGRNTAAQLGSPVSGPRLSPANVSLVPNVDLSPGTLSAGPANTCAELDAPRLPNRFVVWWPEHLSCWGANALGESGTSPQFSIAPTDLGDGLIGVSLGATHGCAMKVEYSPDGPFPVLEVDCWGDNRFGQLGDNTISGHAPKPILMASIHSPLAGTSTFDRDRLTTGDGYSCVVTTGSAYCWGRNDNGQLGDLTTVGRLTPVPVSGGMTFTAISAGTAHACALTADGTAYCWGKNDSGQLGDGSTTSSTSPVAVLGGLRFASISAGGSHTCARTSTGAAYCWGNNANGQLGIGNTSNVTQPVPVGRLSFKQISAGLAHTCAVLLADASAYCWGLNNDGQLGDGTTTTRLEPTKVTDVRP